MYKLTNWGGITRKSDGTSIPPSEDNSDYASYLRWLAEGNTPEPADVPHPNDAINAEIAAIESSTMVPRIVREVLLSQMVDKAIAVAALPGATKTAAELLAGNIGYVRTKAVDDQIRLLRSQLS